MKPKSLILYHGRSNSAVEFSINGKRYVYPLHPQHAETVEYLAHKISLGKALAFAKSRAVEPTHV